MVQNKKYGKATVDSAVEFKTILNSTADSSVGFPAKLKIWFVIKNMDPWIHGAAARAAARAAAGAAASAAASAATVCLIT